MELADTTQPYSFGQFIYESLGKNRGQLEQLQLNEFSRRTWQNLLVSGITAGPAWKSLTIKGFMPGCCDEDGITCEIRLYNNQPKIEFLFSMKKLAVTDPEGVYVAFPFSVKDFTFKAEVSGGAMVPGRDQIPGSATDWLGIQNYVSICGPSGQVVFVSPEIPLVQLGGINLGKFDSIADPVSPSVYSRVLNNYWTTSFRAYQDGELKWRYIITSASDTGGVFPAKTGWGERIPFVTRVFPATDKASGDPVHSFMGLSLEGLLMVSCKLSPDGHDVIVHLREVSGKSVQIACSDIMKGTGARQLLETNFLVEETKEPAETLTFRPYETRFLKLVY
jgi:hypothetical protein